MERMSSFCSIAEGLAVPAGSKWTAMQRTLGWRHFHVTDKRKAAGETFICMVSTCNNDTKMWLNTSVLKSR